MRIVNNLDIRPWREFVDLHPQGNIFNTPEMYQVFAEAHGYRPSLQAAVDDNDRILALMTPVQVSLREGFLRRLTTRIIAYGGVLCAPGPDGRDALSGLISSHARTARSEALFTELRNLADMGAVQDILQECGYAYEEYLDFLIDIGCSPDQVFQNIGSRTRKHIRHALRKNSMSVEEVTSISQLPAWYDLVCRTYAAARVPVADYSLFASAFEVLYPRGMVKFLLGWVGSTCVAATAELCYKDVIYGWYSGVDRAYTSEMPGELLMWEILRWGAENGYRTYDFGGAGKPGEHYGIRDFKAKFGGQLVCFGRNKIVHTPGLLYWSERGYQIYRKLIGPFSSVQYKKLSQ